MASGRKRIVRISTNSPMKRVSVCPASSRIVAALLYQWIVLSSYTDMEAVQLKVEKPKQGILVAGFILRSF